VTTEFDAARAIREEMAGVSDVIKTLGSWARESEEALAKAEIRLNAVRKMLGFARAELDRKRMVLDDLERRNTQ
jgi:hypothetical protein